MSLQSSKASRCNQAYNNHILYGQFFKARDFLVSDSYLKLTIYPNASADAYL